MKNRVFQKLSLLLVLALVLATIPPHLARGGALTGAKDALVTSRPSVSTAITGAITAGDTTITVASTAGINVNDNITIKDGATTETKVVGQVISTTKLALTVGTTNSYTTAGFVYYKAASNHVFNFTTRSSVSGGSFLITFPVGGAANDGIPDSAGFDFNSLAAADVAVTGFTPGVVVVTSASGTISIPITGTVAGSVAIQITVGGATNKLLNPTKTAASGTADTFSITIAEKDSGANIIDNVTMKVGTIEAVAVTATVSPSFTFTINAVTSATTVAGVSTNTTSTTNTVPFGAISASTNYTVAQYLHIDTNSDTGYAVTAQEDGSLRKSNGTVITDYGAAVAENNATNGFGYSLQNKVGTDAVFQYSDSTRTFNSKGFQTSPVTVMSNAAAVSGSEVYVAYRVRIGSTQPPGDYQNVVTYIATPTY